MVTVLEHMPGHSCLSIVEHDCLSYATYVTNERTNEEPTHLTIYLTLGNAHRGAAR